MKVLHSTFRDATRNATAIGVYGNTEGFRADTYRLEIINIPSESKVLLTGQLSITNPNSVNVGLGWYMRAYDVSLGTYRDLNDATMENITPDVHHGRVSFAVWDHAPTSHVLYIPLCYAASSNYASCVPLVVENNGELDAAVFVQQTYQEPTDPALAIRAVTP